VVSRFQRISINVTENGGAKPVVSRFQRISINVTGAKRNTRKSNRRMHKAVESGKNEGRFFPPSSK